MVAYDDYDDEEDLMHTCAKPSLRNIFFCKKKIRRSFVAVSMDMEPKYKTAKQ